MNLQTRIKKVEKRLCSKCDGEPDEAPKIVARALGQIAIRRQFPSNLVISRINLVGSQRIVPILRGLPQADPPDELLNLTYLAILQEIEQLCLQRH